MARSEIMQKIEDLSDERERLLAREVYHHVGAGDHRKLEDLIGAAMVYDVRGLGTIVRCPSCDNALIRPAHNRGRHWIDLTGMRYPQVEDAAG